MSPSLILHRNRAGKYNSETLACQRRESRTGAWEWERADSSLDKLERVLAADKRICGDLGLTGFDTLAKVGIQWPGGERMWPALKEVSREP
jgi:hypothetical protein